MKCGHQLHAAPYGADLFARVQGWCNMTGDGARIIRGPWFDDKGYQRAKRVSGSVECPGCRLQWPLVDEVEEWTEDETTGLWLASGWGPATAQCLQCDRVFVDTFDDCFELLFPKEKP